jgi:guanylate kinase
VILSAPSGAGKTTIARALLARRQDLGYSVSCTTREPRPGEVQGRDYTFVSREEFLARRARGEFAESAEVHGYLYGTLRSEVERVLGAGRHVVMDIDVQGARQFRTAFPGAVTIFVLPPSAEVLLRRLRERRTENVGQLVARLRSALDELRAVEEYRYVVVNDRLDAAVDRVSAVIDAETLKRERTAGLREAVQRLTDHLEHEIAAVGSE